MITDVNSEDRLVQQTFAEHLRDELRWESAYAWDQETFGPEGLLGRTSPRDVVLVRDLRVAIARLNPAMPESAREQGVEKLTRIDFSRSLLQHNRQFYGYIREVNECLASRGVPPPAVREMHPELCFWALNECQALHHNKRTKEGYRERTALLSRHLPDPVEFVELVLREHMRKVVRRDDVVDALVGSVTARLSRGDLKTLPETSETGLGGAAHGDGLLAAEP